jgi:predicted cytidylate kinase
MRITLSGDLGSGKSTIGTRLSKQLGIPYISTGRIFREIGRISNMDALQVNLAAEDNSDIDFAVDRKIKEIDQSTRHFIIDSRLAWHFVHDAMKVYLSVSPETAAARVMADRSRTTETYSDPDTAMRALKRRRESESKRYGLLYGVDIDALENYDLVIITDDANVDDIVALLGHIAGLGTRHKFWIPKTRVVPMIPLPSERRAASSIRFELNDSFLLRLCVDRNFGFCFENANDLASAFHYSEKLIPYVNEPPPALPESEDIFDMARTRLNRNDLHQWEKLGGVCLSFANYLQDRRATTRPPEDRAARMQLPRHISRKARDDI